MSDALYVLARAVLPDALEALGTHRSAVVVLRASKMAMDELLGNKILAIRLQG